MNQIARRLAKLEEQRDRKYPWGPLQAIHELWDQIPEDRHEEFQRHLCGLTGEDYETEARKHAEYEAWLATLSEDGVYAEQVKAADAARWDTYVWLCKVGREYFGEDFKPYPL